MTGWLGRRGFVAAFVMAYMLLITYYFGTLQTLRFKTLVSTGVQQYALLRIFNDTIIASPLYRHMSALKLSSGDSIEIDHSLKFFRVGLPDTPGFRVANGGLVLHSNRPAPHSHPRVAVNLSVETGLAAVRTSGGRGCALDLIENDHRSSARLIMVESPEDVNLGWPLVGQ